MAALVVKDRYDRIYPNPSKRLAPDFPFQPQVYRFDERICDCRRLTTHRVERGPEYVTRTEEISVDANSPAKSRDARR